MISSETFLISKFVESNSALTTSLAFSVSQPNRVCSTRECRVWSPTPKTCLTDSRNRTDSDVDSPLEKKSFPRDAKEPDGSGDGSESWALSGLYCATSYTL